MKRRAVAVNERCTSPVIKRTKVHAQRKFAQGASNYITTPTKLPKPNDAVQPFSPETSSVDNDDRELNNFSNLPTIDDFLTFLCYRETDVLPQRLNYLNTPQFESIPAKKKPSKSSSTSLSSLPSSRSSIDHSKASDKVNSNFKNKKKVPEYPLRSKEIKCKPIISKASRSLALKHNQRLRKIVQTKFTENKLPNFKAKNTSNKFPASKNNVNVKVNNVKNHTITTANSSEKETSKITGQEVKRVTRRNSNLNDLAEKPEIVRTVARKSPAKPSLPVKELPVTVNNTHVQARKLPPKTLRVSVTKLPSPTISNISPIKRSTRSATARLESNIKTPSTSSRPTRKTKEAATLYMETLGKDLLRGDESFDEDDLSIENYFELPIVEPAAKPKKEIKEPSKKPKPVISVKRKPQKLIKKFNDKKAPVKAPDKIRKPVKKVIKKDEAQIEKLNDELKKIVEDKPLKEKLEHITKSIDIDKELEAIQHTLGISKGEVINDLTGLTDEFIDDKEEPVVDKLLDNNLVEMQLDEENEEIEMGIPMEYDDIENIDIPELAIDTKSTKNKILPKEKTAEHEIKKRVLQEDAIIVEKIENIILGEDKTKTEVSQKEKIDDLVPQKDKISSSSNTKNCLKQSTEKLTKPEISSTIKKNCSKKPPKKVDKTDDLKLPTKKSVEKLDISSPAAKKKSDEGIEKAKISNHTAKNSSKKLTEKPNKRPEVSKRKPSDRIENPEVPVKKPVEKSEKPETPARKPVEKSEKPEIPSKKPVEKLEKPEIPAIKPVEKLEKTEIPAKKPVEKPEAVVKKPTEKIVKSEGLVKKSTEKVEKSEGSVKKFTEKSEIPVKKSVDKTDKLEVPVKKSVEKLEKSEIPIKKSVDKTDKLEVPVKKPIEKLEKSESFVKKLSEKVENSEVSLKKSVDKIDKSEAPVKKSTEKSMKKPSEKVEKSEVLLKKSVDKMEKLETPVKKSAEKMEKSEDLSKKSAEKSEVLIKKSIEKTGVKLKKPVLKIDRLEISAKKSTEKVDKSEIISKKSVEKINRLEAPVKKLPEKVEKEATLKKHIEKTEKSHASNTFTKNCLKKPAEKIEIPEIPPKKPAERIEKSEFLLKKSAERIEKPQSTKNSVKIPSERTEKPEICSKKPTEKVDKSHKKPTDKIETPQLPSKTSTDKIEKLEVPSKKPVARIENRKASNSEDCSKKPIEKIEKPIPVPEETIRTSSEKEVEKESQKMEENLLHKTPNKAKNIERSEPDSNFALEEGEISQPIPVVEPVCKSTITKKTLNRKKASIKIIKAKPSKLDGDQKTAKRVSVSQTTTNIEESVTESKRTEDLVNEKIEDDVTTKTMPKLVFANGKSTSMEECSQKPIIQTIATSSSKMFCLESKKIIFKKNKSSTVPDDKEENSPRKTEAFSADNENSVYAFEPDLPTTSPPFRRLKPVTPTKSLISGNSIAVQVNFESNAKIECSSSSETQVSSTTDCDDRVFYIPIQTSDTSSTLGVAVKLDTDGANQKIIMSATLVTKSPSFTTTTATTVASKSVNVESNVAEIIEPRETSKKDTSDKIVATADSQSSAQTPTDSPSSTVVSPKCNKKVSSTTKPNQSVKIVKINKVKKPPPPKPKPKPVKTKNVKTKPAEVTKPVQSTSSKNEILEAPTFYPTEAEFNDPLKYIDSIRPAAEKFGLCRIVPPSTFRPECKVADEMRFTAYNQYVHKMLHRWGPNVKEMIAIKKFLATQNIQLTQAPLIGGMEVDLPRLYQIVQQCGGLSAVIQKERWHQVADVMKIPKLAQDRITKLDDIYCKYLLPYDILSHDEREKLFDDVEKDWNDHLKNPNDDDEVFDDVDECIVKGRTMPLSCFYRIARNTMMMCFGSTEGQGGPSTETIETEFWNHVSQRKSHICVHSGSIDTGVHGYGFSVAKNSTFRKHPWNLKVLTNNSASILRSLGPIMGVTVPTLHVGMLYSACCWYRDPHGLPWVEYLHTGANKIWYGIPDEFSEQFSKAMRNLVPRYCRDKGLWLPSDTVMVPPPLLAAEHVPLSRVVQQPGQFIVVFPKAFTSCISTGYMVSESVYFAHASWLNSAKQIFSDMQESCEPSVFSLEQLLISVSTDVRVNLSILDQILPLLIELRDTEVASRKQLVKLGLNTSEKMTINKKRKPKSSFNDEDNYECEVCRANLFVSLVINSHKETNYCLKHAVNLLQKKPAQLKYCKLMCAYSEDELDEIIKKVQEKMEAKRNRKPNVKSNSN
ncbi:titin [Planococcus citri]|uniref:titin n=1 Tax=Planococcus citri TaxID=170843 RepID=UPI0031F8E775